MLDPPPQSAKIHRPSIRGVKHDDVISSVRRGSSRNSEGRFRVLSVVLLASGRKVSPMHAPFLRSTDNLQPPSVGPGVRQPLLPFGSCSLAPPWLAFEYNTWPSSSDRPGEPKRTVIMLMRGHCCVHRGRPAECRISFFPSLERPPLSPTPPLWREKPRRSFSRVLDAFHRTSDNVK